MSAGSAEWNDSLPHARLQELRYALEHAHEEAHTLQKAPIIYQPGDITVCNASVIRAFYDLLQKHGYRLTAMDLGRDNTHDASPIRYCVVNRHLGDNEYEVYILTTFRKAQSVGRIASMGQYFSIPMGATPPLQETVPPIAVDPPDFSKGNPSFLLAIPTRRTVLSRQVNHRVPRSELDRIAEHAQYLTYHLPKYQARLRQSVRDMYWGEATFGDDMALTPTTENGIDNSFVDPAASQKHSPVIHLSSRHAFASNDLRWVLRDAQEDMVVGSSNYPLNSNINRPRFLQPIPPYYAPCLRISSSRIMRIIR